MFVCYSSDKELIHKNRNCSLNNVELYTLNLFPNQYQVYLSGGESSKLSCVGSQDIKATREIFMKKDSSHEGGIIPLVYSILDFRGNIGELSRKRDIWQPQVLEEP